MVLRAAVNLTVLMAFIPALTRYFMKQRCLSQTRTDQYITIASGVCLMIGSIFIFLSETPMILILGQIFIGLGFAFTVTARSFLTTMTDAHHLSILYSGVASVTYGGVIVGGPLLAGLFQWGLHLEQGWVGVPFLLTAIMFAAATVAVSAAKGGFGRISVP
jgi:MFS family permease